MLYYHWKKEEIFMNKPKIFISHITEEAELAKLLKEIIDNKFLGTLDVFVSSNDDCIKLGDNWINTIKDSLDNSKLIIVLCSPISISRPWINFEAGAGWLKGIPVIPLCHSGLTPSKLPVPINSLQGGIISNENDIKKLFKKLSEISHTDCPDYKDKDFFEATKHFETKIQNSLLVKDTVFLFELLFNNISLIKYSIYASTMTHEELDKVDIYEPQLDKYEFTFNHVHNLFNPCLLVIKIQQPTMHIYQVLYEAVQELKNDIKFILLYNSISIPPLIQDLLKDFLFSVVKVSDWYRGMEITKGLNFEKFKEDIKLESLPPKRRPGCNIFNWFIDYYESLVYYKNWISKYENAIKVILQNNDQYL